MDQFRERTSNSKNENTSGITGLLSRVMALETSFIGLREEVEEGVKRANSAWGRVRAAESAFERKKELEGGEGEPGDPAQLHIIDGEGSELGEVSEVQEDLDTEPLHIRNARAQGYI